jgi:hypothetical protein
LPSLAAAAAGKQRAQEMPQRFLVEWIYEQKLFGKAAGTLDVAVITVDREEPKGERSVFGPQFVANAGCPILVAILIQRLPAIERHSLLEGAPVITCTFGKRAETLNVDIPCARATEHHPAALQDDRWRDSIPQHTAHAE